MQISDQTATFKQTLFFYGNDKRDVHSEKRMRQSLFPLRIVPKMNNLSGLHRILPIYLRLEIRPSFKS